MAEKMMGKDAMREAFRRMCLEKTLLLGNQEIDLAVEFAQTVLKAELARCEALCKKHYKDPQILRATKIDEDPFRSGALDCAELIRMFSEDGA